MDRAYDDYLKRHGQREKAAEQKRARLQKTPRGLDGAPIEEDEEATAAAAAPVQAPVHEVSSWLGSIADFSCWAGERSWDFCLPCTLGYAQKHSASHY